MDIYLGVDVGSVTVKFAALDAADNLVASLYLPVEGRPAEVVREGLAKLRQKLPVRRHYQGRGNDWQRPLSRRRHHGRGPSKK